MEKRICEACHTATEDTFLTVGERENICLECATKMANEAKAENREIEIPDENGAAWFLCTWCEELFPDGHEWRCTLPENFAPDGLISCSPATNFSTRPQKRKKAAGFLLPPGGSRHHRSGKP